ncbi:MAG: hypothetical protein WAV79_14685, partial [Anaerolineae bacterium]
DTARAMMAKVRCPYGTDTARAMMAKVRCPYGTRRAHQDGLAMASHMDGYIWNCWSPNVRL